MLALGIAFLVARMASQGRVDVRLGTDTFSQQDAEEAAEEVAERGPDPLRRHRGRRPRHLLQHLGDDPASGWIAVAARPAGRVAGVHDPAGDRGDEAFRLLDPTARYRASATAASSRPTARACPRYPVTVDADGKLDVDLNAEDRATSTTGAEPGRARPETALNHPAPSGRLTGGDGGGTCTGHG